MYEHEPKWMFIIDTMEYAGEFERELTAYVTGVIGDCGVGNDYAALFVADMAPAQVELMDEAVMFVPDEHGCSRPCSIVRTPQLINDAKRGVQLLKGYPESELKNKQIVHPFHSVAIFFENKPTTEVIDIMKYRSEKFTEQRRREIGYEWDFSMEILGYRLLRETVTYQEFEI